MSRRVAIVGVGYSDVGRNTGRSERHHAAQAAVRALDDAGLTAKDIDGASTWGGDAVDFGWMLGFDRLNLCAQDVVPGEPLQTLGRHAVDAAEVAAVGDRDPEIVRNPPIGVS